MKINHKDFIEATERPDAIWLSLKSSQEEDDSAMIIDWSDINEINGDFGTISSIAVVGIPLYGRDDNGILDAEDVLLNATNYVFNQIEIREKTKENQKLIQSIGSD